MHQHHEESSLRLNSKLDMSWLTDAEQKAAVAVEASYREDSRASCAMQLSALYV